THTVTVCIMIANMPKCCMLSYSTAPLDAPSDSAFVSGIYNHRASLEVNNTTFRSNQAIGGNNAIGEAPNLVFVGTADGGAIFNDTGGQAVIRDSTIEHNQAIGGNGNRSTASLAFAGAALAG